MQHTLIYCPPSNSAALKIMQNFHPRHTLIYDFLCVETIYMCIYLKLSLWFYSPKFRVKVITLSVIMSRRPNNAIVRSHFLSCFLLILYTDEPSKHSPLNIYIYIFLIVGRTVAIARRRPVTCCSSKSGGCI